MAKFVRIKDHLINIEKVQAFRVVGKEILVYYDGETHAHRIACDKCQEAQLIFEDIPHLIDNNYIPNHMREHQLNELKWKAQQTEIISTMDDSNWDELPFQEGV